MFKLNEFVDGVKLDRLSQRYKNADPLSLKACFMLLRSGTLVLNELENLSRKYNLNQSRFHILDLLNHADAKRLTVSEITEKLDISRATTSILLDALEQDGLTKRTVHGGDRRRVVVELLPRGIELMDELLPQVYARIGQTIGCLTEGERQDLITLLERINQSIDPDPQ